MVLWIQNIKYILTQALYSGFFSIISPVTDGRIVKYWCRADILFHLRLQLKAIVLHTSGFRAMAMPKWWEKPLCPNNSANAFF